MTQQILGGFPTRRLRRLRKHDFSRRLVAENTLTANDLIIRYLSLKAKIIVNQSLLCLKLNV